jgi:hypothetical protein
MINMNCMKKAHFQIVVVNHAVDKMDPDVNTEMEFIYTGVSFREQDPVIQTCAKQDLPVAASDAKGKVINTHNIISPNITGLLLANVLGFTVVDANDKIQRL